MKRICLLSDTHGHLDDRMTEWMKDVDEVWHAGDFGEDVAEKLKSIRPIRGVYGNIDGTAIRKEFPEHLLFQAEGVDVLMIHIAGPFGTYAPGVRSLLDSAKPKLLVCGHSHILKVQMDSKRNVLYMNPGAAGKHGFHHMRTLLRFNLRSGNVENLEVIELGKRGSV